MTATQKNRWLLAACLCLIALFLVFGDTVAEAVRGALHLCARTVIPALFPLLVLSALLTPLLADLRFPGEALFERLFHLPRVGLSAFLLGAVCGFPIGARTAADLCRCGLITKGEGERLASLSANTGPAFAVLAVGKGLFGSLRIGLILYVTQLVGAILLALPEARKEKRRGITLSGNGHSLRQSPSLPDILYRSSLTMLSVTGTVLFFAALTSLFSFFLPKSLAALGAAVLEVSNGCAAAATLPAALGIPLAAFAISFSGASVLLQSAAELSPAGIPLGRFVRRKLYQGLLAAAIALLLCPFLL